MVLAGYNSSDQLHDNSDCFQHVSTLITSAKARLMKLTGLTSARAAAQSTCDESNAKEESVLDRLSSIFDAGDREEAINKSESILISKLARDNYNDVIKELNRAFSNGKKVIKSHHDLSKGLAKVIEFSCSYNDVEARSNDIIMNEMPAADDDEHMESNKHDNIPLQDSPDENNSTVVCDGAVVPIKDCVDLIMQRTKDIISKVPCSTMQKALDNAFLILCADGAVHPRLPTGGKSIITYSMTLGSYYLIKHCGVYPSSGKNILPHVQLRGKENVETLRACLAYRMQDMTDVKESIPAMNECRIYDLADGKALYLMTGHTHWASGNHPFLICKCNRGDSADPDHECSIYTTSEYANLAKSSKEQWDNREEVTRKRNEWGVEGEYDYKAHRQWCAVENCGVSHMGAFPMTYDITQLRFDVFHGRSAVVKVFLKYIRNVLEGIPRNVNLFGAFLGKLNGWDGYVLDPWMANEQNSRLKGRHTKSFTKHIPKCVALLKSLMPHDHVRHICECLLSFHKMSMILSLIIIDEYDDVIHLLPNETSITPSSTKTEVADAIISEYTCMGRRLYLHGHKSFMTKRSAGDKETFYLHTMRWYCPNIMKTTYIRNRLGIGIFTMEGYE